MSILSQFKQSQNTDFPNVRPSLDLRFALAKKLDPRITFTRGSTGTYFGSDGLMRTAGVNEPRFDHDPITGQSLGLMIEESRSNLLTYSEDFSNAIYGIGSGSISTNTITAPDGTTTADAFIENTTSNAYHFFNQFITKAASSITYTLSIFVKSKGGRRVGLRIESGGAGVVSEFNVVTGTNTVIGTYNSGFSNPSSSIIKYPNDWYRITLTVTSNTSTSLFIQLYLVSNTTNSSVYTGNGTSGIYVWGAQLEQGSFPTSYIPTTASTVTRSADNAQMTGTNFSSWYNQSEGTLYADLRNYNSSSTGNFGISIGSAFNNYFAFPYINSLGQLVNDVYWRETGSSARTLDLPTGGSGGKYAISYKNIQSFFGYLNGSSGIVGNPPYPTQSGYNQLYIGRSHFSSTNQNFYLRRLTYYPIQLTNQQLINLTS